MRKQDNIREMQVRTWQMSFNDLLTVLLTFFILLVSMSNIHLDKVQELSASAAAVFGSKETEIEKKCTQLLHQISTINGLSVSRIAGGISVTLPESLLYHSGSADIIDKDVLRQLGLKLKAADGSIRVEGHTDEIPMTNKSFPSNWELSTQRAVNVVKLLVGECGIDPGKLSAAGYADSRPVAPNDSPEGRALNRRVNVIISVK
jgi:chemotaxis protein MotB